MSTHATHLNVQALTLVAGLLIPFLTSVVTKQKAPPWAKAAANALLAAVAGAVVTAIGDGGNVILGNWVIGIGEAFGASVASYFGILKPTGVANTLSLKSDAAFSSMFGGSKSKAKGAVFTYDQLRNIEKQGRLRGRPTPQGGVLQSTVADWETIPTEAGIGNSVFHASSWFLAEAERLTIEAEKLIEENLLVGATPMAFVLQDIDHLLVDFDREVERTAGAVDNEIVKAREGLTNLANRFETFLKSRGL